jgi:hypothetical protein
MKAAVKTKFAWILLVVGVAVIAGCVEEKKEYTINPDGSGKVNCDIVFAPFNLNFDGGEDASSESQVKEAVEKILDDSEGVDAWQNISFELTDEGKIHFIGTAYFADINKVKIKSGGFNSNQSTIFSRDGAGRITIEIKGDSDSEDSGEKDKEAEKLTEAEVSQKVKEMRLQYNKSKPMMLGMLGTLKSEMVFHLPGRIEEVSNFTKVDDSTVKLTVEGAKMLAAMDKMMADDKLLAEQVRTGKNPMQSGPGDELRGNEMLYGQRAPVRVVAVGGKELFDYKAEVATAKANYKAMLKGLGFGETMATVVATGEAGSVVVGGVRLIRYTDKDRGIRPFNYDKGYTISLVMELPEPDMEITIGRVEKATADTGQDLLPKKEWDRKISWPKLTKDGKGVKFEVKLLLPGDNVKGLAELSGSFDFLKSTGAKEVDLGMMDFKDGSQSKVEGFSISSVKTNRWDKDNEYMQLKVDLLLGAFKGAKFYGENGEELKVSKAGTSSSMGRLMSIGFRTKGSFPERGRIVLETLKDVSKHRIGFKLSNVSLLGVPLD